MSIINTVSGGEPMPDYAWVECEVTTTSGLPFRLVTVSSYAYEEWAYPKSYHVSSADKSGSTITVNPNTGELSVSGPGYWADITYLKREEIIPVDVWEYIAVDNLSATWRHWYQFKLTSFTSGPDPGGPSIKYWYDKRAYSEPTYTTVYGKPLSVFLTEQTGSKFQKIKITK